MNNKVSVLFMLAGILFATCLLISNILASKIIMIGPWSAPAGVLIFPLAYIINDVIAEVWGYRKARLIIWAGFGVNLLAVLFFSMAVAVPAAPFYEGQNAFASVLGNTPRIVAASLLAYLFGSFLNAFVMSRVKVITEGKSFSLRAIVSTLAGESIDSLIFISVAFAGVFPVNVLLGMIVTQAVIKTVYEIIVLPLTLVVVKKIKQLEGEDTFDYSVSYNPFRLRQI
ncbi:queuosine precursor transporter [Maribellus comscasis]|uniref:Probable queuosine precursor transporter n=1 Tax=Maribellus comscasis TaxID=2681766 RepID=A0A6I6JK50_9BACT|nr:queuosine precursor transporter [Maribellus comscasis]QGY43215.1 queuosine precursor transporter [Maribellus comscasis]